jgi:hypothetical protein
VILRRRGAAPARKFIAKALQRFRRCRQKLQRGRAGAPASVHEDPARLLLYPGVWKSK